MTDADAPVSEFMRAALPRLLDRYRLCFTVLGDCIEYFLVDKETGEEISRNLVMALNRFARQIEIVRFYPELYTRPGTRYFSAACLYLMIHHFAGYFKINGGYRVFVRTRPEIYDRFYRSLLDFDFRPKFRMANTIDLVSGYERACVDTSCVAERGGDPDPGGAMAA